MRQRLTMFAAKQRGADLERLSEFLQTDTVVPRLDRTFPLDQSAEARRYLERRGALLAAAVLLPDLKIGPGSCFDQVGSIVPNAVDLGADHTGDEPGLGNRVE